MARQEVRLPSDHPAVRLGNIGVLLMNLGTPDATSYWPMRRYLKEFLSDRRVIEINPVAWWFILNGLVLTRRPQRSGHAYERIWNRELDESPLRTITRAQSDKLSTAMTGEPRIRVDWAMRYGNPAIGPAIERLKDQGCDRILLFPLYPQYSAATVATAYDKAFDHLKTMRWQPAVRAVPPYHDHPAYIDALARSVRTYMEGLDWKPDVIVASFHGLPEDSLAKGDPYHCHCQKTTRLLRTALALPEDKLVIAFQSRFGRAEWLKPYTDDKVAELARGGAKNLLAITPGFSADCVETLEEIDIGTRAVFMENGGENFSLVPCLNDSAPSVAMLNDIVRRELLGWL
jgi:protoporphyrin/coproporphyrin ferrochelatase